MINFRELDEKAQMAVIMEGTQLGDHDAIQLERELEEHSKDIFARMKLLGFYQLRRTKPGPAQDRHLQHVLWVIENYPDHPPHFGSFTNLSHFCTAETIERGRTSWLKQVNQNPTNSLIIGNAGSFLAWKYFEEGMRLLQRAQELDPQDIAWPQMIGTFNWGEFQSAALEDKEHYARIVLDSAKRLNALGGGDMVGLIVQMWLPDCEPYINAEQDAGWIEELQQKVQPLNQYIVNARLGLEALEKNEVETAVSLLLKEESGRRVLHPAVCSLAHGLCLRDQGEVIIKWMDSIDMAWFTKRKPEWTAEIRNGVAPTFRPYFPGG